VCTVTVVPAGELVRIVVNRDEQRSRARGEGARVVALGARRAVMPIDPESGGTWVGANDAGVVACLLNVNGSRALEEGAARESRGVIVPLALAEGTLEEAAGAVAGLGPARFRPFRVLLVHGRRWCEVASDGARMERRGSGRVEGSMMLTSSGLGDALVEGPRRALFDRMLGRGAQVLGASGASAGGVLEAQQAFHEHRWEERPEVSVLMNRPDARTVSRTVVDVSAQRITLLHRVLDDAGNSETETMASLALEVATA
jgi:hypothetical protein